MDRLLLNVRLHTELGPRCIESSMEEEGQGDNKQQALIEKVTSHTHHFTGVLHRAQTFESSASVDPDGKTFKSLVSSHLSLVSKSSNVFREKENVSVGTQTVFTKTPCGAPALNAHLALKECQDTLKAWEALQENRH